MRKESVMEVNVVAQVILDRIALVNEFFNLVGPVNIYSQLRE
jgi:hypothetical protein